LGRWRNERIAAGLDNHAVDAHLERRRGSRPELNRQSPADFRRRRRVFVSVERHPEHLKGDYHVVAE
jgi:hypothetical protein